MDHQEKHNSAHRVIRHSEISFPFPTLQHELQAHNKGPIIF